MSRGRRQNVSGREAEQLFRQLVQDEDIDSLDVALDVLEEAGLTLEGVSERWIDDTRHRLGMHRMSIDRYSGIFVLASPRETRASVRWTALELSYSYDVIIEGFFGGLPWRYQAGLPYKKDNLRAAIERGVVDAWFAVWCMRARWNEDPQTVADIIQQGATGAYDRLTLDTWIPPTAKVIMAPAGSIATNPPASKAAKPARAYRPQKIVAELQRDARPEFAGRTIGSPEDVAAAMIEYMGDRAHECFVAIFINIRNGLVGFSEFTSGSMHSVEVFGSGIMREALASGAAGIITVHQHPTGNSTPSSEDFALWERLREIGQLIGIPVVDNMVVGQDEYFSQAQNQRVKFTPRLAAAAEGA